MRDRSVHDNNVYAYAVNCAGGRIDLYTEFGDGPAPEFTDVVFTGVLAHHFVEVLSGNILFDVTEVELDGVIAEWADLFAAGKNYGWPEGIEYDAPGELSAILKQRNIKAFRIHSSYGLAGWVFAEAVEFRPREARYSTPA